MIRSSLALAVSLLVLSTCIVAGQEPAAGTKKQNQVKEKKVELPSWRRYLEASLREYNLDDPVDDPVDDPKGDKFTLTDKPVFIHAEPLDGEERGVLYLWKNKEGRPVAAITGILSRYSESDSEWRELHEFHSLWDASIAMYEKGKNYWLPSEAGVTWEKFSVDSKAGKTERLRQLQMKKVARRFKARMEYKDRGDWNLRLIDKPIYNYTYQTKDKQSVSGGVFAFCRSTDPEVLLLIESRSKKEGKNDWFWASVCFAGDSAFLSLDEKEVWKDDPPRFAADLKHSSRFKNYDFNFEDALKNIEREAKTSEAKPTEEAKAKEKTDAQDGVKSK